jgi:hypothetical protein
MPPISATFESTIVGVKVSFDLSRFDCSPDEISSALGLSPDHVLVKGEKRTIPSGHEVVNEWNCWSIDSRSTSKDVNEHIRELLERLRLAAKSIRPEWGPSFNVVWRGNYLYAGSGPFYERDVVAGIAELRADLWQDIYQIDEPEG